MDALWIILNRFYCINWLHNLCDLRNCVCSQGGQLIRFRVELHGICLDLMLQFPRFVLSHGLAKHFSSIPTESKRAKFWTFQRSIAVQKREVQSFNHFVLLRAELPAKVYLG